MIFCSMPWLELAIASPILGILLLRWIHRPHSAVFWSSIGAGFTLLFSILAWMAWYFCDDPTNLHAVQKEVFGRALFQLDELSAPLPALVALLHLLTLISTSRTRMQRFSPSWLLMAESVRLATFASSDPWVLTILLILGIVRPWVDLVQRGQRTRVYLIHMLLFSTLLLFGTASMTGMTGGKEQSEIGVLALLIAILIRAGTFPLHCWVMELCERAAFGPSILFLAPLTGVYGAIRLVLPTAPDWALQGIGIASIITSVYAACMATIQLDTRRFFAYLYLSQSALVLVGLELHTSISLTGALSLWFSTAMSVCGIGLTIRALESRHGRLGLKEFHGLYEQSPTLAVGFLMTGLACVGFPGTLGFVASELLVDGAVETHLMVGLAVVLATALNGIAIMRVYFLLFTGRKPASSITLNVGRREQIAVLTLVALLIAGGLAPQAGIASRHAAAEAIIRIRDERGDSHESLRIEPRVHKE